VGLDDVRKLVSGCDYLELGGRQVLERCSEGIEISQLC